MREQVCINGPDLHRREDLQRRAGGSGGVSHISLGGHRWGVVFRHALVLAILVVASSLASPKVFAQPPELAVAHGPYLQNLTSTSVTIAWDLEAPGPGAVRWGPDASLSEKASSPMSGDRHVVTLRGLEPATRYHYRVEGADAATFTTAPEGPSAFTFAVCGDTRTGHDDHRAVLAEMLRWGPAFILNTGDLVEDGASREDWDTFWRIVSPYANGTPYWPTLGNHDLPPEMYLAAFHLPGIERWYSFDHGDAHFVCLDSTSDLSSGSPQHLWLEGDLGASSSRWTFVWFHYPPYSSGKHGSHLDLRDALEPVFVRHNVTAVFNGHDHSYEHALHASGVHYFVTGGGGAPLYSVEGSDWTVKSASVHHFIHVEVGKDVVVVKAVDVDGEVVERVKLGLGQGDGDGSEEAPDMGPRERGWLLPSALVVLALVAAGVWVWAMRRRG